MESLGDDLLVMNVNVSLRWGFLRNFLAMGGIYMSLAMTGAILHSAFWMERDPIKAALP
jgi:hypothetical protein